MERRDVVIVGAGPAGLAAALRLRELGCGSLTVLEREAEAGGVPRHCGHLGFGWQSHRKVWTGPQFADALRAEAQGLDIRTRHSVLEISGKVLRVHGEGGIGEIAARRILLATGARESSRAARLVGGARPQGVMNTGALQQHVYLRGHRPFARPVIVGSEWVSFSAILTCRHIGIQPVAMIEARARITAPRPGGLIARLVYGVPVLTRTRLLAIEGRERVEAVEVEQDGERRRIACDGVILSGGFVPESTLLTGRAEVTLAGNVHGALKTSGLCLRDGRAAAEALAKEL